MILPGPPASGNPPPTISVRSRGRFNDPWTPCPHASPPLPGTPRIAIPSWEAIEHLAPCAQAEALARSIAGHHLTVLERSGGELAQLRYAAAEARLRALRLTHALHRLLAIVEGRS